MSNTLCTARTYATVALLCLTVPATALAHPLTDAPAVRASTGNILIMVQTDPDGAPDQFTFTHTIDANSNSPLASPFTMSDGGIRVVNGVNPGVYSITQTLPSGWDLVAFGDGYDTGCSDDNSVIDLSTGVATVNVAAEEFIVCTFVNRKAGIPEPPAGAVGQTLSSPRGLGYWKNWAGCITEGTVTSREAAMARRALRAGSGTYPVGSVQTMTCEQVVRMLSKQDFAGVRKANDAAYNLAAQLLAAKLNKAAGAPVPACVETAMNAAQQLLTGLGFNGTGDYLGPGSSPAARTQASALAGLLGRYNDAEGSVLAGNCG